MIDAEIHFLWESESRACSGNISHTAFGRGPKFFLKKAHKFRVAIHSSQCIVDLEIEDGETLDIFSLRNIAADAVGTLTDLVGYQHAICFDVEILSAIRRDNDEWFVFGIDIPALAARRVGNPSEISTDRLIAVTQNIPAMMVLADFRKAIRDPVGTGFYCYRCLEAMMQSMKEKDDEKDAVAWEQLRERLQIDRSAIDAVKAHADFPRHGRPSQISDAQRARVFDLTDEMIRRFLSYLTGGKRPLSENDFEILRSPTLPD